MRQTCVEEFKIQKIEDTKYHKHNSKRDDGMLLLLCT